MKKVLGVLLTLVLCLGLTACGGTDDSGQGSTEVSGNVQRVSICNILCTIKNGGLHMRKMGKHIPGLIVTLVVLITAIVFAVMLLNMKVIPTKFIAGVVFVSRKIVQLAQK